MQITNQHTAKNKLSNLLPQDTSIPSSSDTELARNASTGWFHGVTTDEHDMYAEDEEAIDEMYARWSEFITDQGGTYRRIMKTT